MMRFSAFHLLYPDGTCIVCFSLKCRGAQRRAGRDVYFDWFHSRLTSPSLHHQTQKPETRTAQVSTLQNVQVLHTKVPTGTCGEDEE